MVKIEEQKYFLALMYRPGNCIFIDISKLDIASGYNPVSLQDIDSFTMCFSKDEIMEAITRANIADNLNGELVIQDNQKHNPILVIDKTLYSNFQLIDYLVSKINDKNTINTITNKFAALNNDKNTTSMFKELLKNGSMEEAAQLIYDMPYKEFRKLFLYLIELKDKEQKEKEQKLIREAA